MSDEKGNSIIVERERLDGLWIGLRWSSKSQSIRLKINHLQIDNQLSVTLFPTILYPIVSKSTATDFRMFASFHSFEEEKKKIFRLS